MLARIARRPLVSLLVLLPIVSVSAAETPHLAWHVEAEYPHDPHHFTQGLEIYDGSLYESVGRYGQSAVLRKNIESGEVLKRIDLPASDFAEGLTRVNDGWLQLTWLERRAYLYDESLRKTKTLRYPYEGWGVACMHCDSSPSLVTSDGSAILRLMPPDLSNVKREIVVRDSQEMPVERLNELESIGDFVLANIWQTNRIVVVDTRIAAGPSVVAELDLTELAHAMRIKGADPAKGQVLNGIAWDAKNELLLITGKQWPSLFALRIDKAPWMPQFAAHR